MNPQPLELKRLGDHYQLVVETPGDLARIVELDPARWMANSAPVEGLSCDALFLRYLDCNKDGRIQPDELVEGISWMFGCLRDAAGVAASSPVLVLEHLDPDSPDGRDLLSTTERILINLGNPDAHQLHIDQLRDRKRLLGEGSTNGDGVIPWEIIGDPELRAFVKDVATTMGPAVDASGKHGATAEQVEAFSKQAIAWLDWRAQGDDDHAGQPLRFWGDDTHPAYAAVRAVAEKIEEFFALCELAALDPRLERVIGAPAAQQGDGWLARAPLTRPQQDGLLRADAWLHPDWRGRWDAFSRLVLDRLGFAGKPLSAARWTRILERFQPYAQWLGKRPDTEVHKLGRVTLERYLSDPRLVEGLQALVHADKAVAQELERVADVERLILFQHHLLDFTNNFVSFCRFYDPRSRSLPEAGTLLMDGRNFQLCVRVADREAHKKRAGASGFFLLYVQVHGNEGPYEVAVAVTGTHRGDLHPGKRGVFFTLDGGVLPAVVVDLLENPISVGEALRRPFDRLGTFLAAQADKFTESRYARIERGVDSAMTSADASLEALPQAATETPTPAVTAAEPAASASDTSSKTRELLLSGGVALAALSSALAYIAKTLSSIGYLNLLIMALLLALCFTVPTAIITAFKLRRRDLAPVLEASGWGINYTLRVPGWASPVFTRVPPLPTNVQLDRTDLLREYEQAADSDRTARRRWQMPLLAGLLVVLSSLVIWRMLATGLGG